MAISPETVQGSGIGDGLSTAAGRKWPVTPVVEDWAAVSLSRLMDHLVHVDHAHLRRELPRLEQMMTKVALSYGLRYLNLLDLAEAFLAMKTEVLAHMAKEEQFLFPLIECLEKGECPSTPLNHPLAVIEVEHRHIDEAWEWMRVRTENYAVPSEGCVTYRTLMAGLAALETELRAHLRLESEILFPRAAELAKAVPS